MAYVRKRRGKWCARWQDATGKWCEVATTARTKVDAERFARDLEARGERQRSGLDPLLPADGGGTVEGLLTWWLTTYSTGTPTHRTNETTIRKHLLSSPIAGLTLAALRPHHVEQLLQAKAATLAPQTLNHLRGYLGRAFTSAKEAGRWPGVNPIPDVRRRKVPRPGFDYLRREEVQLVLEALAPAWRPLFATAIYTGARQGELCGLRKTDVDLSGGFVTFTRSWDRPSTKSGKARTVPVHTELVPYLRAALDGSPSALAFPRPDGRMHSEETDFPAILRRALKRADIVTGYRHVCRARVDADGKRDPKAARCGHVVEAQDREIRRCPVHVDKLWPSAQVRKIRFHDLRHTCASLMLQAGVTIVAVSRILGHADVRITLDRYGHLAPDFMRAEIEKLTLAPASEAPAPLAEVVPLRAVAGANRALVGRDDEDPTEPPPHRPGGQRKRPGVTGPFVKPNLERETGFEPATLSLGS